MKAIIVNDDPTQLCILSELVRKAGLEPGIFADAESALADMTAISNCMENSQNDLPALIVTDLYMPGIDGWRFCRLLRSPEYKIFNHIPILLVSATFSGDEPDRIAADLGAEGFLPSPVDGKRFVEQVQTILTGKKLRCPLRALIVEDSMTLAHLLQKTFMKNGFHADSAFSLREAATVMENSRYDIAVIDHHMPDGFGTTLLNPFLKKQPDCVCILMTTDASPSLALECMKQGAAAFLRKPFDPEYLIEMCIRARRERAMLRIQDLLETRTRELRSSEAKNRALLNAMPDMIFLLDRHGVFLDCHTPDNNLLIAAPEKFLGQNVRDVLPADIADKTMFHIQEIIRTGQTEPYVYELEVGGNEKTFESRMVACAPSTFLAIVRDISQQKSIENALKRSEKKYRELFESVPVGLYQYRMDGKTIVANPACLNAFRYFDPDRQAWLNQDIRQSYVHEMDRQQFWDLLMKNGFVNGFEAPFHRWDGTIGWLSKSAQLQRNASGEPVWVTGSFVDITERKTAEEALRNSESRYHELYALLRLLADTMPDMLWAKDLNKRFIFTNRAVCQKLLQATDVEEPIGKNDLFFAERERASHPENPDWHTFGELCQDSDAITLENMTETHFEEFGNIKGKFLYLDVHKAPLINQEGVLTGVVGSARDITDRKQAEAERENLQTQLNQAQKMESVGRLAGGVAHDFNNMLQSIIGHSEMALDGIDDTHPLHGDLSEILKAARRSADLTRQLLAFARKQTISPRVVNLNDTVASMMKMLTRLMGENIECIWKPAQNLWPIKIDPSQVDQIMANLCINARDAILETGSVIIETHNIHLDESRCKMHMGCAPGDYVLLKVGDTGEGMEQHTRDHMFEPFFTTKKSGEGTGLGLSMVYGIVKQNNGVIDVDSKPGYGTTFCIFLPRTLEQEMTERVDIMPELPCGTETILLVEDDETIIMVVQMALEKFGYTVLPTQNPHDALILAQNHSGPIHLLITDVIMPEMNGQQLLKKIESIRPGLPALFISGYTADIISRNGRLDESVNFLQKPFSVQNLVIKVRCVLDIGPDRLKAES